MKGKIFLFVGIILIAVGVIVSQSMGNVSINHQRADAETARIAKYAIGGGVGGLGVIFAIVGFIGIIRGSQSSKRIRNTLQNGIDAEGTVTFADKNYTILVNKNPIYSIIEYTYQDKAGNQHIRRINNASSELVIRMKIQVGAKIPIKYSAQDPGESVIVL